MVKKKDPSTAETGESFAKDALQRITGIGPAVEKRLNNVGIYSFAQLAALSPADIAAAIADLSSLSTERIIKQDWTGQAHALAAGFVEHTEAIVPVAKPENDAVPTKDAYHPATLTVELLLDEQNNVYTIQVLHIQSRRKHTWMGWQTTTLEEFLRESVGVNIPIEEPAIEEPVIEESVIEEPAIEELVIEESVIEEPAIEEPVIKESVIEEPVIEEPAIEESVIEEPAIEGPALPEAKSTLIGVLRVSDMEAFGNNSTSPGRMLTHDTPFDVHLTLELARLQVPNNTPLHYKIFVYSKGQGKSGQVVGKARGTIIPTDQVTITVGGNLLPEGIYRLAATVTVGLPDTERTAKSHASGVIDGGVVHVY